MEKSLIVQIKEFEKRLEELINSCNKGGIPWWKIKDELEYVYLPQIRGLAIKEEEKAIKEYEEKVNIQKLLDDKRKDREESDNG